jgi:hypothetical protein
MPSVFMLNVVLFKVIVLYKIMLSIKILNVIMLKGE